MIDWSIVTAMIAVLGSAALAILAWRKAPDEARNARAEAEGKISEAALQLLEPMKARISDLERIAETNQARMKELDRRISELECELRNERSEKSDIIDGAHKLAHQVESLGANPVYRPPSKRGAGDREP